MAILGIDSLIFGVADVGTCVRYFEDFGLNLVDSAPDHGRFELAEGSSVVIRHRADPALPATRMEGDGVREVIWGVDTATALDRLAADLARDCDVRRDADGVVRFMTPFGLPMGLRVFAKRPVLYAPDPVNAPGRVNRLNQHRKWRERARPKVINHVVFAIPGYQDGYHFMRDRLGFRLSDHQVGFGMYLRSDGSNNHHSLLLLNANAPFPGMDGAVRFHHANFGVEDIDEMMTGANHMARKGWEPSEHGLGRHRIDSALFYYLPCPAGGEAEYGADSDYIDDSWVPREWTEPLFAYAHYIHNLPHFLHQSPSWNLRYLTTEAAQTAHEGEH
ncbi:VOC family protein [Sphingomonas sp. LT1P40]|uniref:VOC family protein n=1 Tax=Alteristakelama amylovorans TaxID=3096166 RepID=UPI002FCB4B0E